jgi:uncharacterized protein with HEPN domain
MSRDQQSIQDMWNATQEIISFTTGMSTVDLASDRRTQAAVLYEIVIIGEAESSIPIDPKMGLSVMAYSRCMMTPADFSPNISPLTSPVGS